MSTENADMATGATAEEIDEAFDRGEDMRKYFDFERGKLKQPDVVKEVRTYRKVNVDFPADMVDALDAYAAQIGIGRQSLVKAWIWERLREEQERDVRLGVTRASVEERK